MSEHKWLYVKFDLNLWSVGFFDPARHWHSESEHVSTEAAAERVHFLNGGDDHDEPRLGGPSSRNMARGDHG